MKKTINLGVATMLALGAVGGTFGSLTTTAHASENSSNEITEVPNATEVEDTTTLISEIESYIHKDAQGFLYVDSDIPIDLYNEYKVDLLEEYFEEINEQVANGQVEVNDDLSIIDKSFTTFASKGYTSKKFWWGERATYTNAQTKKTVGQLEDAGIDIAFIGAAYLLLPPIAGGVGLTSAYCGKLAKSMKSKNKGKGVIVDMTWALAYKVKSR
ncbi:hypothetical protein ABE28_003305 [Peribacillus muralis]|uniref:Uncharacterized protein n=1 Tax=Peribacillus muralis TaxID=264697 RepID=A0A1B3XJF9_9BACI|nr:hypothetical protein [Peribacillus muralis]AOH53367.1 hypothetical protein ABE28_003305 [Peribacillus muralis]